MSIFRTEGEKNQGKGGKSQDKGKNLYSLLLILDKTYEFDPLIIK